MRRALLVTSAFLAPLLVLALVGRPGYRPVVLENPSVSESLVLSIDSIGLDDGVFACEGALYMDGEPQWYPSSNKHIWLRRKDSESYYQLSTSETISAKLRSDTDANLYYKYAGFQVRVSISALVAENAVFDVLAVYQVAGSLYAADTGYDIVDGVLVDVSADGF